jgi:hypothetical protein
VPARSLGTVFGTVYIFPYAAEVIAYAAGAAVFAAVGARSVLLFRTGRGCHNELGRWLPLVRASDGVR